MKEEGSETGILYVTATPIGNLEDITYRAVNTLKSVDLILSEDTRKTGILLKHYEINTAQKSYRVHHLQADTQFALERLREGKRLALCTDAGTPGISDPGSYLVNRIRQELPDIPVIPVPGPSAMNAMLSVCGWQINPSIFGGFLSTKSGKRKRFLEELVDFEGIILLYESVHRMEKLLLEIRENLPGRDVLVGREITKIHEQHVLLEGSLSDDEYRQKIGHIVMKGEFTVVVGPGR